MSKPLIARPQGALDKAGICEIHKKEWQLFRESVLAPAADSHDPEEARFAKAIADSIRLAQEGERKAYELATDDASNVIVVRWAEERKECKDGGDAA